MKILLLLFCLPLASLAQTMEPTPQEQVAIMQAVDNLFEGMKKADSTLVRASFTPTATLQTVTNTMGMVSVKNQSVDGFVGGIGKAKPKDLDEEVQPYQIMIDGDLATTFVPYTFRYKGEISHCGANAITLVRLGGEWKIQAITDTRRPCL